jgi:hypothetical protein
MGGYVDDIQIGASASSGAGAKSGSVLGNVTVYEASAHTGTLYIIAGIVAVAVFVLWLRRRG